MKKRGNIMTTKTLSKSDLAQFRGSENWYWHGINRNVLYTDGVHYVAEHGGAHWLLDEIAIIQPYNKAVAAEEFQVWKLAVRPDRSATLTRDDGNGTSCVPRRSSTRISPWTKLCCTSRTT
jgi:hypothetical protein